MANRPIRLVSALAAMALMSACSLAPAYHPPTVTVPVSYKDGGAWRMADTGATLPARWWEALGDPVLDSLEERIPSANPTLAIALARYERAKAYLREAGAAGAPQVGIAASPTSNRQSDNRPLRGSSQPDQYGADTLGLGVDLDLDLWGKVKNSVVAGKAEVAASRDTMADVQLSLEAQLALDYVKLRGEDRQLALLRETVDAFGKADALVERRFKGGIASGIETARSVSLLSEARAQVEDVRAERAQTEHAIASLTGTPASDFTLPEVSTVFRIPAVPTGVPSSLLQRRPDIASAERKVAAANAEIGVAKAAFFPSITLGGTAGFQSTGLAGLIAAPNLFWSIGPSAVLNLLDGGRRRAKVAEARANWEEATATYRGIVLQGFQDVEDQLALLDHLTREQTAEELAASQAEQAQKIALNRYVKGAATYLDVVTAQTTALQLRQSALKLETRRVQADVSLMRALGGGWTNEAAADLAVTRKSAA